ncbi:hypothetical protein GY45DRAFT_702497 [Cubamyces sp. BRFM 1775]|nr:hypothetical protein GY45DRAFT_702497 [Cubamyces sp. BRFM 1775]
MSLPTPPGTSHRDEKDNRGPRYSRVSWCETAQYRAITSSPPRTQAAQARASRAGPSRSILKKPVHPISSLVDENAKEGTPEPPDPLADLHYLESPVSRILAPNASLRDLIEGYSVLTTRLRASVNDDTDADASWPLFQPLRKRRDLLVEAIVRDLRQVFIDPLDDDSLSVDSLDSPRGEPSSLPSPRDSPKKKRGMTAEQVKRARDLCGVCHAVLRLLGLVFVVPAMYQLFTEDELGYILTHVLAIPLANELPTPNSRKTCALAIWLIQTQRLPAEVLEPAKDRIAYALRRGIEGELGKEGKKGSTSDGLKAVHDLSLYLPSIFVPAFAPLVPAILTNLLAPTLVLRNQACHALGGFALAVASLPPSEAHTRISTAVATRLVKQVDTSGPLSPAKKALLASPSKDSALVRTLRTTLQTMDPKHAAQGPVWAFSVIAHLVVLLGPTVFLHNELTRVIMALFMLGLRHQRSSVRGLGCLAWRAMTWAYFRPPHVKLTIATDTDDDEEESATEDDLKEEKSKHDEALRACFKYLSMVVEMGAGVGTVGALLGHEPCEELHVRGALRILRVMSKKGGQTCKVAMDVTRHIIGFATSPHQHCVPEWEPRKLLAPGLFSSLPGLLTAEWKTLSTTVKGVLEQCPQLDDVRPLTLDEIAADGIWDDLLAIWKHGLSVLRLQWGSEEVPSEIREIWFNLLKSHAAPLLDAGDHDGLAELAVRARDVLIDILDHDEFDFTLRKEELGDEIPTSPVKSTNSHVRSKTKKEPLPEYRWNFALKLFLVRDLLTITRAVFPEELFAGLAESVLKYLNSHEEELVGELQNADEVRDQWASLCAEAAFACDLGVLQAFWTNTLGKGSSARRTSEWDADVRAAVWETFLDRWGDIKKSWETAIILLSVPFVEASGWELASEDLSAWDEFLKRSIDAALDCGVDAPALIDHIAGAVAAGRCSNPTSSVRVADLLLSNLEISEAREVPCELFQFASDTLNTVYPPLPRHKVMCMWLIRSLTRVIDACPTELCFSSLLYLSDGLCTWLADEYDICTVDEYSSDILPLYQTILVSIQALEKNVYYLDGLAPLLEAPFRGRQDKHVGVVEAFADFWQETYAQLPQPSSGWGEQVARCLEAVAREREDEASVENLTAIHDDSLGPCDDDLVVDKEVQQKADSDSEEAPESEDEGSVALPSPGTLSRLPGPLLRPAVFARGASPQPSLPPVPSTPKSAPRVPLLESPSLHTAKENSDLSPASSIMDSSPTRAPTTPKRSPAKGPRSHIGDKENKSPLVPFATVTERLAMRSPLLLESILGKRPREDDSEELDMAEKAFKRGRLEASPLAPSIAFTNAVQVHMVTHEVHDESSSDVFSTSLPKAAKATEDDATSNSTVESESSTAVQSTSSASRKRKGTFLDAVVVPSVAEVIKEKRRFSVQFGGASVSLDSATTPQREVPVLRRTRSATRVLGKEVEFQRLENTPKRRRMSRAHQLREEAASDRPSSPSGALRDAQLFGSDDSIMLASPSKVVDQPPSDDEPPMGQVTPHRLVSPALRRVQHVDFNSDPPSDDSNLSNSPSSERVVRKMARLGNERFMRPTPLNIRPRSMSEFSSFSDLGSDL